MAVALTTGREGINRYRIKGGAKPDTLFDLKNAYVTVSGTIRPRPGTRIEAVLPEGTIGLTTFKGKLIVFADHFIDLSAHVGFQLEILTHPNIEDDDTGVVLRAIHFAEPFLGYLYVVAEWSTGEIFHYWLEDSASVRWQANHVYMLHERIGPEIPNGLSYRATRLGPPGVVWEPDMEVQVGDIVEPTVFNGFEYEAIEVYGDVPRTGTTEPAWVAEVDALVNEDADVAPGTVPVTGPTSGGNLPPQDVLDRYGIGPNAPWRGLGP